jgi:hypothetical protein
MLHELKQANWAPYARLCSTETIGWSNAKVARIELNLVKLTLLELAYTQTFTGLVIVQVASLKGKPFDQDPF